MRPPGFTFCLFERQIVDMECRCSAMARFESSRSRPTVIPPRPTIFAISAVLAPVAQSTSSSDPCRKKLH